MTEQDVKDEIKTSAVLKAFESVNLSNMPPDVRAASYDEEAAEFARFSKYTSEEVALGKAEGKEIAKQEIAKRMKRMGLSREIIMKATGLSAAEVDELPVDTP
jgi:predicted transposase/invertase (TIGR01784 family)